MYKAKTFTNGPWSLLVEVGLDDGTTQAYLEHGCYTASLACADATGVVTNYDGEEKNIPQHIINWANVEAEKFGY